MFLFICKNKKINFMCNNFEQNNENSEQFASFQDLNLEVSVQSMTMEFLALKSNSAKLKNKYVNSLKALKLFVEPN